MLTLKVPYILKKYTLKQKRTFDGDRTHDHKIKSLALYHLSYEGSHIFTYKKVGLPGWTRTTDLGIAAAVIYHLQSPALPTELPRGYHIH